MATSVFICPADQDTDQGQPSGLWRLCYIYLVALTRAKTQLQTELLGTYNRIGYTCYKDDLIGIANSASKRRYSYRMVANFHSNF